MCAQIAVRNIACNFWISTITGRIQTDDFIAKSSLGTHIGNHLQKPTGLGLWRRVEGEVCKDLVTWPGNVRSLSFQSWSVIMCVSAWYHWIRKSLPWHVTAIEVQNDTSNIALCCLSPHIRNDHRANSGPCVLSGCLKEGGDRSGGDSSGGSGNGCCLGEGGCSKRTVNKKRKE